MHSDVRLIADHMKDFGLRICGRAIYDATFSEDLKPFSHALSVVHAAHAAEIIIKSKIAEEHPLLIFSQLPAQLTTENLLTVNELFEYAKSYSYEDLPNLLWATTGLRVYKIDDYKKFGKLRNKIVHFAVPDISLSDETLKFTFNILAPLVKEFWNISILPYAEEWDETIIEDGYLKERIKNLGIHFE